MFVSLSPDLNLGTVDEALSEFLIAENNLKINALRESYVLSEAENSDEERKSVLKEWLDGVINAFKRAYLAVKKFFTELFFKVSNLFKKDIDFAEAAEATLNAKYNNESVTIQCRESHVKGDVSSILVEMSNRIDSIIDEILKYSQDIEKMTQKSEDLKYEEIKPKWYKRIFAFTGADFAQVQKNYILVDSVSGLLGSLEEREIPDYKPILSDFKSLVTDPKFAARMKASFSKTDRAVDEAGKALLKGLGKPEAASMKKMFEITKKSVLKIYSVYKILASGYLDAVKKEREILKSFLKEVAK